jgi:hypothetical protein
VPSLTTADLETLARMDVVVRGIRSAKPDPKLYGFPREDTLHATHELVAKSLGAMHTVATLSELPQDTQRHPDVQRRLWASLPDVHDATMSMADRLDAMTAEERRRVDERIRKDDGLPMRIAEVLDGEAKARGIPDAHRFRMRTIATHIAWRLKTQGAGAVIDDLVGKVDRVIARHGVDAELQRAVAAKVAEAQLFGFPPAGDPTDPTQAPLPVPTQAPVPTASSSAPPPLVPDTSGAVRARFRTTAPRDAIQRIACSLQARVVIEGRQRPIDLRVVQDGAEKTCGFEGDAPIRGTVRLRRDADVWDVLVELEPPEGTSAAGRDELRVALRDVGGELRRRVLATERSTIAPAPASTQPESSDTTAKPKSRTSSKILTASAIVWGIGLAAAGVGGLMIAAGNNDAGLIIGGAFVLTVASLLGLAGIVTLIIAGAMYAAGN